MNYSILTYERSVETMTINKILDEFDRPRQYRRYNDFPILQSATFILKRFFDYFSAALLLLILTPLLALISILIMVNSPGLPLYKQLRKGKNQVPFYVYKFRTMVPNAHQKRCEMFDNNQVDGIIFKLKNDPRITKVGAFLRKYSIDELPQLINVLRGEMSLIGPRPFSVEVFEREFKEHKFYFNYWLQNRHKMLPGITGLWQVSGRNNLPFRQLMKFDLHYVNQWNLLLDIKILGRTIFVVINHYGAY
ncbi:MAG: hypothetical protein A2219_01270 [Elusimicrobia bacterium RIFOXYA2_FULL_50_26]|nr:MAG: hypothetical protein A2219_01270 [Elusimicrobia bacterium RIFOXYA2_FULL_50_26]